MKEIHQIWDKLFKVVGEHYLEELLDFIFPHKKPTFQGKFEQERIVLEYQIADLNFWVQENGIKKLLNIEPYSTWNRQTAAEVFTRNAIITKSLDIISVAVRKCLANPVRTFSVLEDLRLSFRNNQKKFYAV